MSAIALPREAASDVAPARRVRPQALPRRPREPRCVSPAPMSIPYGGIIGLGPRRIGAVMTTATADLQTTVLHVGGLHFATEKNVVEHVLGHRPGVLSVDAN